MQKAAAPEVVDGSLVDALVVAEDHALQHLAHGWMNAYAQMRAGGQTQAVDGSLEAAAAPGDAQVGEAALKRDVLAAAAQIAAVVEGARPGRRQRLDAHGVQLEDGALHEGAARIEHEGLSVLQPQPQVGGLGKRRTVDGADGDGERDLVVFGRRQVGEHRRDGHGAALVGLERGVPKRIQAAAAHGDAGDEEHGSEADGERRQPGRRRTR